MDRVLLSILATACLAGCQVQDPFAAFGPPRVPAPKTAQSAPYYPPTASASKQPLAAASPALPRISVSAEGYPPLVASSSRFATDSTDREPIRIVENPSTTRTASANRSPAPSPVQPPPQPQAPPSNPAKVPTGKSSGIFHTDPAVAPAAYQQASPAFIEPIPADGQWRAR